MNEKEVQEIAQKIVKEVSMLPNLSEYEAMMLCATKGLRFKNNPKKQKL